MQQDMIYVYEVYKAGSFSKAAQKLYVSQPALSIAIKKIEDAYGMPLFDRNQKPLALTEAGELYIQAIETIRQTEEDLSHHINDLTNLCSGHLTIGATHYFNAYVLPFAMHIFSEQYPMINISLKEGSSNEMLDRLLDGELDMIFMSGTIDKSQFRTDKIFDDTILLAVPKHYSINNHLKAYSLTVQDIITNNHQAPNVPLVPLAEFGDVPFLLLTSGNNLRKRSELMCQDANFQPNIIMELEQLVTSYHLAEHGIGAAFISDLLAKKNPDSNLLYYKLDPTLSKRNFYAVTHKKRYLSIPSKTFIKTMKLSQNYVPTET